MLERVVRALRDTLGDCLGPAIFIVLAGLVCQLGLGFGYAMKPLAGDIIDEFGWSRSLFILAQSPITAVYAFSSLAVGTLVGRLGTKRILVVSIVLLAMVFALYSRMQEWWQFSALVVVMGFALTGLGDITVGQLVSQWVKRGRGFALGLVYTGSNLGGYLFIPFVVGIADQESWREAFSSLSLVALFFMLPVAVLVIRERPAREQDPVAEGDSDTMGESGDLNLAQALRTRSFWILAFSLFTFFVYFMGLLDHLVLHLTDEGIERADASNTLRTALGLGIASKIGLGLMADRMPHRLALFLVFLGLSLSSVFLLLLPGGSVLTWAFIISFGFSTAARDVVYPLILTECFGLRHMAPIYGALMIAFLPGATLGPVFAAAVQDNLGSYDLAFISFLVMNLLALLGMGLLRDERDETAAAL